MNNGEVSFNLIEALRELYSGFGYSYSIKEKQETSVFFKEHYPNEQILRKLTERRSIFCGNEGFNLLVQIIQSVEEAKENGTCCHVFTIGNKKGQHCTHKISKNDPNYCCCHSSKTVKSIQKNHVKRRKDPYERQKEREYIHQKRMKEYNK